MLQVTDMHQVYHQYCAMGSSLIENWYSYSLNKLAIYRRLLLSLSWTEHYFLICLMTRIPSAAAQDDCT